MESVASDALENQRRSLLFGAPAELKRHERHGHEHMQEYRQGVWNHLSEVQQEVQIQQVTSREEVEILRHELSQSFC